jgi:transposase-like protein
MPRTRPPYAEEFRLEAVELVRSGRRSLREAAEGLGVSQQTLRNWIKQAEVDVGRREGVTSDERECSQVNSHTVARRLGAAATTRPRGSRGSQCCAERSGTLARRCDKRRAILERAGGSPASGARHRRGRARQAHNVAGRPRIYQTANGV